MKRPNFLLVVMMVFIGGAAAQAQQRSPSPSTEQERQAQDREALRALQSDLLNQRRQEELRGGGGRGAPGGGIGPGGEASEAYLRELERFVNKANGPVIVSATSGAWWTNTALIAQLGITSDQKAKIEKSFESHRLNLESSKALLEKEEAQLARLLEAESVDRNAATAQIYRVVNARGEMERANATMTLDMREHLTRAQWVQLQAQTNATMRVYSNTMRPPATPAPRGARQE